LLAQFIAVFSHNIANMQKLPFKLIPIFSILKSLNLARKAI